MVTSNKWEENRERAHFLCGEPYFIQNNSGDKSGKEDGRSYSRLFLYSVIVLCLIGNVTAGNNR